MGLFPDDRRTGAVTLFNGIHTAIFMMEVTVGFKPQRRSGSGEKKSLTGNGQSREVRPFYRQKQCCEKHYFHKIVNFPCVPLSLFVL